jgi:hypothetical protein
MIQYDSVLTLYFSSISKQYNEITKNIQLKSQSMAYVFFILVHLSTYNKNSASPPVYRIQHNT